MTKTRKVFARFLKDSNGSATVEALFAFPMLIIVLIAVYSFFDAYRAQNANYRANYTISDMVSRQTGSVDANYINGLHKVYKFMTKSDDTSWIRVTVLHCVQYCADPKKRNLDIDWSYGANGARPLDDRDFNHYDPLVPLVAQADRLILIETSMDYKPPFERAFLTFPGKTMVSHVATRPRFAPTVKWDHKYDENSGGNHSDNVADHSTYDTDPDIEDVKPDDDNSGDDGISDDDLDDLFK